MNEKFCNLIKFPPSFVTEGPMTITQRCLDNGLVPNRRLAIIWTDADPIHWRIYAALGGDELKPNGRLANRRLTYLIKEAMDCDVIAIGTLLDHQFVIGALIDRQSRNQSTIGSPYNTIDRYEIYRTNWVPFGVCEYKSNVTV